MLEAAQADESVLLIEPTGGGKTLAGFLPSLVELEHAAGQGLHTLYVSPLKALTTDIARNLQAAIEEIGLAVRCETRTGDTPQARDADQLGRDRQVGEPAGEPDRLEGSDGAEHGEDESLQERMRYQHHAERQAQNERRIGYRGRVDGRASCGQA
jgi:ATP-dependent helicase YprA (DUF1998 family)